MAAIMLNFQSYSGFLGPVVDPLRARLPYSTTVMLMTFLIPLAACSTDPNAAKADAISAGFIADDTTAADAEAPDSSQLDAVSVDAASPEAGASDAGASDAVSADVDTSDVAATDAGPVTVFAIAAIADPHLTKSTIKSTYLDRLEAAVAWLNEERKKRGIEVVLVLGDIGWSGGLKAARTTLNKLDVPFVPALGDNCIFAGDEQVWDTVFGPHYASLAPILPGFSRGVTPTTDPGTGKQEWLQNVSFDLHGVHIVSLDLSPRKKMGFIGELGERHDHVGGTWPWLKQDLNSLITAAKSAGASPLKGSVLLASHIPMHQSGGALTADDVIAMNALAKTLPPGLIHASIAGHYHIDAKVDIPALPFTSYVVGSVFSGPLAIHIATATVRANEVTWQHEVLALPGWE